MLDGGSPSEALLESLGAEGPMAVEPRFAESAEAEEPSSRQSRPAIARTRFIARPHRIGRRAR